MKILILNGPNLNMLGIREPQIYGTKTYSDLVDFCKKVCVENDIEVEIKQSNHEGTLVDIIQDAYNNMDAIVINAAGYTHTSVAIHDALKAVMLPVVEVHLSNPDERDEFRRVNFIRDTAIKTFKGEGFESYRKAVMFLKEELKG